MTNASNNKTKKVVDFFKIKCYNIQQVLLKKGENMTLTRLQLEAIELIFSAQVAKARADLEVYFQNSGGIGEHSELVEEMQKKIQTISDNQSYLDTLRSLQGIKNEELVEVVCEISSHNGQIERFSEQAAGFDLKAVQDVEILPWATVRIGTGVKLKIPKGYEGQVRGRSGLASVGIVATNSPGTVDADYRGEVMVILTNLTDTPYRVQVGDRVAQIVFSKIANTLLVGGKVENDTERGQNGFGSTGK